MKLLFLFIDGVGLGDADADINPLVAASLPALESLLDGVRPIRDHDGRQTQAATLRALDATLGMPGLPQSGTGQTALFTGKNASSLFGRHFGPWVPTALRQMLSEENLLTVLQARAHAVAFANAYPEEVFEPGRKARDPLRAGPPIAALGAGVMNRHTPELLRGDAVASEITNDGWRKHLNRTELPIITARQAGENIVRIAASHDFTMFAHYHTDHVGHTGSMPEAIAAIERVDEFVAGILSCGEELDIIVASDHGNLEDVRAGHTTNPALGLFIGPHHRELSEGVAALTDVAPRILEFADSK